MPQYRFEIEVKDDDLLETLEIHKFALEAESEEEALTKFEWIAAERGWQTQVAEEFVDGNWTPAPLQANRAKGDHPHS